MFIGYYNYTVWLTYISLAVSAYGLIAAQEGRTPLAVLCLLISGILDTFDGKVARTKKNRDDYQKKYGIQIDSLSDIVCFGLLAAVIAYREGMKETPDVAILLCYCVAGLIRLGYFNVMEEERQKATSEKRSHYRGLPITSSSIFVPLYFVITTLADIDHLLGWRLLMGGMGLLFILNIKVRKPGMKGLAVMGAVLALAAAAYFIFGR